MKSSRISKAWKTVATNKSVPGLKLVESHHIFRVSWRDITRSSRCETFRINDTLYDIPACAHEHNNPTMAASNKLAKERINSIAKLR